MSSHITTSSSSSSSSSSLAVADTIGGGGRIPGYSETKRNNSEANDNDDKLSSTSWDSGSTSSDHETELADLGTTKTARKDPKDDEENYVRIDLSGIEEEENKEDQNKAQANGKDRPKRPQRKSKEEIELSQRIHRVHLLTLLCRQKLMSDACNDPLLQATALSYFLSKELIHAFSDATSQVHNNLPTIRLVQRFLDAFAECVEVVSADYDYSSSRNRRLLRRAQRQVDANDLFLSQLPSPPCPRDLLNKISQYPNDESSTIYCNQEEATQLFVALLRGLGLRTRITCSHYPTPVSRTKHGLKAQNKEIKYCDFHPVAMSKAAALLESESKNSQANRIVLQRLGLPRIWVEVWCIKDSKDVQPHWTPFDACRPFVSPSTSIESLAAKKDFPSYIISHEPVGEVSNSFTDTTPRYISRWSYAYKSRKRSASYNWLNFTLSVLTNVDITPSVKGMVALIFSMAGGFNNILAKWCEDVNLPFEHVISNVLAGGGTLENFNSVSDQSPAGQPIGQEDFHDVKEREPLPTSLTEFASHPTYCLPSLLKEEECIDPSHSGKKKYIEGFFHGEPVYRRSSVISLKPKDKWLREHGRQVKDCELGKPVKKLQKVRRRLHSKSGFQTRSHSRNNGHHRIQPRVNQLTIGDWQYWDAYDKDISSKIASAKKQDVSRQSKSASSVENETYDLPLYSFCQTEPYEPPVVQDGKIPRNDYGNVELPHSACLPRGAAYLADLPRRACKVIRNVGIDVVEAVVGFEFKNGVMAPKKNGVVVPEEHKETVLEAWNQHELYRDSKATEKHLKEICKRWGKLVKAALLRQRLREEYYPESKQSQGSASVHPSNRLKRKKTRGSPSNIGTIKRKKEGGCS